MKISRLLSFGFIALLIISAFFAVTNAFFSDAAQSTTNTFSAAAVFPTATPSATIVPTVTPTPAVANHIVISEVQINGANANQDFVELHNPTNSPIDISGWKLRKKTSNGTETSLAVIGAGKSIPAHGFFLWANDQSGYNTTIGADEANSNNLSENNGVAFLTPADTLVDALGWGTGSGQFVETTLFPQSPATNQSTERKALSSSTGISMSSGGTDELKGNGFDSDNNANDFVLRLSSQPQNSISSTEAP